MMIDVHGTTASEVRQSTFLSMPKMVEKATPESSFPGKEVEDPGASQGDLKGQQ
jgi:hypothetical protein